MNLKVKRGSRIEFVLSDGLTLTWEAASDTDTSHLIETIARFETMQDYTIRSEGDR